VKSLAVNFDVQLQAGFHQGEIEVASAGGILLLERQASGSQGVRQPRFPHGTDQISAERGNRWRLVAAGKGQTPDVGGLALLRPVKIAEDVKQSHGAAHGDIKPIWRLS